MYENLTTPEQIREHRKGLDARLAALSGKALTLWSGDRAIAEAPAGGATLTVQWAIEDQSYCNWYPTVGAARAALAALANVHGRAVSPDGWRVDLTARGCVSSQAWVTRHGEKRYAVVEDGYGREYLDRRVWFVDGKPFCKLEDFGFGTQKIGDDTTAGVVAACRKLVPPEGVEPNGTIDSLDLRFDLLTDDGQLVEL